jgi:hypothetical protein
MYFQAFTIATISDCVSTKFSRNLIWKSRDKRASTTMNNDTFHLGLCMAGSISAGAYTAGVIDYLQEALGNWEQAKKNNDTSLPNHKVIIDLLGGSSGGGITAALAFFGLRSNIQHARLEADQETYAINPEKNIYWKTWVELGKGNIFSKLLDVEDLESEYIPSLLNASFVDEVADIFKQAIMEAGVEPLAPAFIHEKAELFLTLFNLTGIKYRINTKSPSAKTQFLSEHRDIAHFQWGEEYQNDGRMEVSFGQTNNLETLLGAAKATGAFPVGLRAREITREAKYIWDNPFFGKNKFSKTDIDLGASIKKATDLYTTLNGDGGTANNEPIEFCRDLMLDIRIKDYEDIKPMNTPEATDTEKAIKRKTLTNSSVILIDPFPAYDFEVVAPANKSDNLAKYIPKFLFALSSQLIFDAKDAFDAYDKDSYGLHVIAPSRNGVTKPQYAIACGSLGGFGGFLNKSFRVHDFFLGRHNCQSFLRKFFVVDLDEESDTEAYSCVEAVIDGYKGNQAAIDRFSYVDEHKRRYVPIIPDLTMQKNIFVDTDVDPDGTKKIRYVDPDPLPLFKLDVVTEDYLMEYRELLKTRIRKIIESAHDSNFFGDLATSLLAMLVDDKIADKVLDYIRADFKERGLM